MGKERTPGLGLEPKRIRAPLGKRLAGVGFMALAGLLYDVSPIDLIPDVFFPAGIADDIALSILLFRVGLALLSGNEERIPSVVKGHVKSFFKDCFAKDGTQIPARRPRKRLG